MEKSLQRYRISVVPRLSMFARLNISLLTRQPSNARIIEQQLQLVIDNSASKTFKILVSRLCALTAPVKEMTR